MKNKFKTALPILAFVLAVTAAIAQVGGTRPSLVTSNPSWSIPRASDSVLVARLTDLRNNPVAGQQITFFVQSPDWAANVGRAYTDNNGYARVSVRPSSFGLGTGNYRLVPQYVGNGAYSASIPSFPLAVR